MRTVLKDLTDEQLRYVCGLRLDGKSLTQIASQVDEEAGIRYSSRQYGNFFRSTLGRDLLEEIHKTLIEHWRKQPLAEKFSRVDGLVQEAQRLQDVLKNKFGEDLIITETVLRTETTDKKTGKVTKTEVRKDFQVLGVASPEYERVLNQYVKVMSSIREEMEPKRLEIKDSDGILSPFERAAKQIEALQAGTDPAEQLQAAYEVANEPEAVQ
jgi:hypothetical protein